MKLLSGLGNLAGALLMTCLGGIAALIKPPAKEPVVQSQRLPHTPPQPIRPLEPKLDSPTVPQPLTPTEAEVLAVAETVAAFGSAMPLANAHLHPTQNTPIIEPEEPTKTIAQPQPAPSAVEAPTDETPEPEVTDTWAVETKESSGAIAQPITADEAIAPLEPEPKAIAPAIASPHHPITPSPKPTTLKTRAEQVYAALDAAWSEGTTSYSKLITAVRETTGKGCSKAKIAAWKKERGLISA